MDLLSPFDLVDRFEAGKTVAVVGNAPTLAGSGLGGWIDGHDVVVRFNDCRLRGFEADVGARTDILIANPYAETRPDSRLDELFDDVVVLVINPQTRRGTRSEFDRWIGRHPALFTYTPDIRTRTVDRSAISLTTGTYGVSLIANLLQPRTMTVTGFTMFTPGADFHYWSDTVPSGVKSHVPAVEAVVFLEMLGGLKCRLCVTPDIADLARRWNHDLGPRVTYQPVAGG